uniref:WD repeat-containing protein 35 n=1 Tax=Cacopsylla melanoneura TaxID=428564 RepID=A0A8D8YR04_9HEMI
MFIYLSKKIAIPNNTKVNCLAWHQNQGWIAVGGDDGLLKVLKLDTGKESQSSVGGQSAAPASVNLAMNQTLQGHSGKVQAITWNEQYEKLTSSDESGLIIVWMLYKGAWCEEMINNRNKSVVKGMCWNDIGLKICIVYEDGAVIVGSVDGNRIWGKEFKKTSMLGVQWSSDSQNLLFSVKGGQVHLYDHEGNFMNKITIQNNLGANDLAEIAALRYYLKRTKGIRDTPTKSVGRPLVVAFTSGCIQFMRSYTDDKPVVVYANMSIGCCEWNEDGTVVAVAGTTKLQGESKPSNVIQFFSSKGEHIRSLKLPGTELSSCAWGPGSLRICLSIDSFIYFANIRPYYLWTYFAQTMVFSSNQGLLFWDTNNNICRIKSVPHVIDLASHNNLCAVLSHDEASSRLSLCTALSTSVDTRLIPLDAVFVRLNGQFAIIASRTSFVLCPYVPSQATFLSGVAQKKERFYHVDDTPAGVKHDSTYDTHQQREMRPTQDPICCITCSDRFLIVGRESGTLQRYVLPDVTLVQRNSSFLTCRPSYMALNCDSTKLGVIDGTGVFLLIDLQSGEVLSERRDVWGLAWAQDNPALIALSEKTRLYVLRDGEPEDPVISSAYICEFKDLEVKTILLDEIQQLSTEQDNTTTVGESNKNIANYCATFHAKALRDTRQLLDSVGLNEAFQFVELQPHPRLWKLLAEKSLERLSLNFAEQAMVKCEDYAGLQLVKTLRTLPEGDETMKQILVAQHEGRFQQAENYQLQADRRDLAIAMRQKIEDYSKVLNLLKIGRGASDAETSEIFENIGDKYAEQCLWTQAKEYYEKCHCYEKLLPVYTRLGDFESLESCARKLPDSSPLLKSLGQIFVQYGLCDEAVYAFHKAGQSSLAVEACVELNQWNLATEYAKKNNLMSQVGKLLEQYTQSLLQQGLRLEVVQLFKATEKKMNAAQQMIELAEEEESRGAKPLRLKRLYLLTALLVDESNDQTGLGVKAWHRAEAYHFLMLAQRQLLQEQPESALKSCLELRHYEDVLSPEQIYCLIALASIKSRAFGTASKAFMKLELISESYEKVVFNIFVKHPPEDSRSHVISCSNCRTELALWSHACSKCNTSWVTCVATGKPILNLVNAWRDLYLHIFLFR